MNENDKEMFSAELGILSEMLSPKPLSVPQQRGYWIGLREFKLNEVVKAFHACIATKRFMPKPSEIRELIEGSSKDKAAIAFECLIRAIQQVGRYDSINFKDRTINAVVKSMGGWETVCDIPIADLSKYQFKRFCETYVAFANRGVGEEQGSHCVGIIERENRTEYPEYVEPAIKFGEAAVPLIGASQPVIEQVSV